MSSEADCCDEERAEPEGKGFNLEVNLGPILTYCHELWVVTKRMRLQIQAAEFSFFHRVAGVILRDNYEELGHLGEAQSRAAAPLH